MFMKIVTSVLTALLIMAITAGAMFYLKAYKPLADDCARMTARMPELDKARIELKRLKDKEGKETAWMGPEIEALSARLSNEIKAGRAEVLAANHKIIVNISEQALYLPDSYTFSKDSPRLRADLIDLLKSETLKGKDIQIGNTTHAVLAKGRGRKKVPGKDARTLAAERSAVLIKDFEKHGVNQDALIAAAYSPKRPLMGSLIKDRKTVIIIENPPTAPLGATRQEGARQSPVKPVPDTRTTLTVPAPRSAP
jgi:hypothetical protein